MPPCLGEQELLAVDHNFILFHSKFEMPFYMKVVSLKNWTTFILGDFEVFR
jgi:hypothetical protein